MHGSYWAHSRSSFIRGYCDSNRSVTRAKKDPCRIEIVQTRTDRTSSVPEKEGAFRSESSAGTLLTHENLKKTGHLGKGRSAFMGSLARRSRCRVAYPGTPSLFVWEMPVHAGKSSHDPAVRRGWFWLITLRSRRRLAASMAVRRSMDTETLLQPKSETGGGHFGRPAPELPQAVGHNADTRTLCQNAA